MALNDDHRAALDAMEKDGLAGGGLGRLAAMERGFGGMPDLAERRRIEALKTKHTAATTAN